MKKPSITDVLIKLDAITQRFDTFDESVTQRFETLDESVTQRFDTLDVRFDNIERALEQHSLALLELSTVSAEHSVLHRQHSAALGRIERRQRAETRAVDDHERRITVLERRPYPPAPPM
jgi:hypothetical protein